MITYASYFLLFTAMCRVCSRWHSRFGQIQLYYCGAWHRHVISRTCWCGSRWMYVNVDVAFYERNNNTTFWLTTIFFLWLSTSKSNENAPLLAAHPVDVDVNIDRIKPWLFPASRHTATRTDILLWIPPYSRYKNCSCYRRNRDCSCWSPRALLDPALCSLFTAVGHWYLHCTTVCCCCCCVRCDTYRLCTISVRFRKQK